MIRKIASISLLPIIAMGIGLSSIAKSHAQPSPNNQEQISDSETLNTSPAFSEEELLAIGNKIWNNFAKGEKAELTSWSPEEPFAYIGIAQNLWYPEKDDPNHPFFGDDWPAMAQFLKEKGYPIQDWMLGKCPWPNRDAFLADINSPRLQELRNLLCQDALITAQAECIVDRFNQSLPEMIDSIQDPQTTQEVTTNIHLLEADPNGYFALIDYMHYKGAGTEPQPLYGNISWGLLQVLEQMDPVVMESEGALEAFISSAKIVLRNRVAHANPQWHEENYLPMWDTHLENYRN